MEGSGAKLMAAQLSVLICTILVMHTHITCLTNTNRWPILGVRRSELEEAKMTIVRWTDPLREFARLQARFNQAFRPEASGHDESLLTSGTWVPPVDIYESHEHELVLKAELPDMSREDIDITVEGGTLTIKGEKKWDDDVKDEQFRRIERNYGKFSRSFALPRTVDTAKVGAEYRNGVLTVRLPLREEAKPRQIKVDVAA